MQIYDGRKSFYQWDLSQKITSDKFAVGDKIHFFNVRQPNALVVKAYELDGMVVADVPNILLQTALPIKAWKYVYGEHSAQTVMEETFDVNQRPQPSDYFYTETELYELRKEVDDLVVETNNTMTQLQSELSNAEKKRVANETLRQTAESTRQTSEEKRTQDETERVKAEALRKIAEDSRVANETARRTAEQSRVDAEGIRESSEQERVTAETARQAWFKSVGNSAGNAIKGYASGEIIRVDDVNPIEHTVKAKVESTNLVPQGYKTKHDDVTRNEDGSVQCKTDGALTEYHEIRIVNIGSNLLYLEKGVYSFNLLNAPIGAHFVIGGRCVEYQEAPSGTLTVETAGYIDYIIVRFAKDYEYDCTVYPILVKSDVIPTEYTPYVDPSTVTVTRYGIDETDNLETYTPNADGTVDITSLSPTMTLLTDTEGVTIDLEYNRDSNSIHKEIREDITELDRVTAELILNCSGVSQSGIHLTDDVTGKRYKIYVLDGKLSMGEVK